MIFSQIQLFAAILLVNILVSITNKEADQTWLVLVDCLPLQIEGWFACNSSAKYQNQSSLATTKTPMLSTMGRDSSVGRKARRNTDTGSSPWCGKGRFSHSYPSVQTLLQRLHSPHAQSHASKSVHTFKIPNSGSHAYAWTHKNTAHTDRNG